MAMREYGSDPVGSRCEGCGGVASGRVSDLCVRCRRERETEDREERIDWEMERWKEEKWERERDQERERGLERERERDQNRKENAGI